MNEVQRIVPGDVPTFLLQKCNDYLGTISQITGRNVIAYYSGWLKFNVEETTISDNDKNAFMNSVYKLDKNKGLDLILHTPGGDIAATESIVSYIKSIFGNNIHAIVPQLSMSAGTMMAMACSDITMGKQSSLGPIDPQTNGIACQMVKDEFERAVKDVTSNPATLGLWQSIIGKYPPTFLTSCEDAVRWSEELAEKWLTESNPNIDMRAIKDIFINHKHSYSHSRHISKDDCRKAGLHIKDLESNQDLQDAVLSLHHCFMILIERASLAKIITNQQGQCYIVGINKK